MKIEALNQAMPASTIQLNKTTAPFAPWLAKQLQETNQLLNEGRLNLQRLAKGDDQNYHNVMLSLAQAKSSLQLIEQVRSRALRAYQEIMKEQI